MATDWGGAGKEVPSIPDPSTPGSEASNIIQFPVKPKSLPVESKPPSFLQNIKDGTKRFFNHASTPPTKNI